MWKHIKLQKYLFLGFCVKRVITEFATALMELCWRKMERGFMKGNWHFKCLYANSWLTYPSLSHRGVGKIWFGESHRLEKLPIASQIGTRFECTFLFVCVILLCDLEKSHIWWRWVAARFYHVSFNNAQVHRLLVISPPHIFHATYLAHVSMFQMTCDLRWQT